MKNILTALLTLVGIGVSDGSLPTIAGGEDIVYETAVTKWTVAPSDACYYQAHKLNECWIIETVYDLGACIECIFAGQPNPNNPTCDIMKSSVIEECAEEKCYGADFCNDEAMDFFNCVVDDECSDPNNETEDDVCNDEVNDFNTCLATTDYDVVQNASMLAKATLMTFRVTKLIVELLETVGKPIVMPVRMSSMHYVIALLMKPVMLSASTPAMPATMKPLRQIVVQHPRRMSTSVFHAIPPANLTHITRHATKSIAMNIRTV